MTLRAVVCVGRWRGREGKGGGGIENSQVDGAGEEKDHLVVACKVGGDGVASRIGLDGRLGCEGIELPLLQGSAEGRGKVDEGKVSREVYG